MMSFQSIYTHECSKYLMEHIPICIDLHTISYRPLCQSVSTFIPICIDLRYPRTYQFVSTFIPICIDLHTISYRPLYQSVSTFRWQMQCSCGFGLLLNTNGIRILLYYTKQKRQPDQRVCRGMRRDKMSTARQNITIVTT